jgi:starch synthase
MNLLMVAAELGPYVRVTEAADSVASLGKALRQLGHDLTLCLPRHPGFEQQGLLMARRLTPLTLASGEEVTVLDGQLASGVRITLLDAPGLFEHGAVYGGEETHRFGWFAQAVAAFVAWRASHGHSFEVAHVHDWPGALASVVLRRLPELDLPIVLTVHDWRAQGRFRSDHADELGLAPDALGLCELGGELNVVKAGLLSADAVVAVSESAFHEVTNDPVSPLGAWISDQRLDIVGILNGIDYAVHNPATDPLIVSRYDAEDVSNKHRCKSDLILQLGLEVELSRPLVATLQETTLAEGLEQLVLSAPALLRSNLTLVVAGGGTDPFTQELQRIAGQRADVMAFIHQPDEATVHRLFAAADMVLCTARHQPAGSVVLRAARYGAVPVAQAVGALRDLVVDADAALETGTGFLYEEATSAALRGGLQRALVAYAGPAWARLRRRIMRQDLSWDRPARRYQQIYRQAVASRRA